MTPSRNGFLRPQPAARRLPPLFPIFCLAAKINEATVGLSLSWESASFATRRPAVRSRSAPPAFACFAGFGSTRHKNGEGCRATAKAKADSGFPLRPQTPANRFKFDLAATPLSPTPVCVVTFPCVSRIHFLFPLYRKSREQQKGFAFAVRCQTMVPLRLAVPVGFCGELTNSGSSGWGSAQQASGFLESPLRRKL